jgi:DNA polymerase-1
MDAKQLFNKLAGDLPTHYGLSLASRLTPPNGPTTARIVVISDYPSHQDEKGRGSLTSWAGKEFDKMLRNVGIDRAEVYVTDLVKLKPLKNDISKAEIPWTDPLWADMLKRELEEIKPNVVIVLGSVRRKNIALNALCSRPGSDMSTMKYRGSVLESTLVPGLKVVPTIHPSAIMNQWAWRQLVVADLEKAKSESGFKEIRRKNRRFFTRPTFNQAIQWIDDIIASRKEYCVDIETGKKFHFISCIGLAKSDTETMCIPFIANKGSYWSEREEYEIWKRLAVLLESDIPTIYQNGLFDMFWLTLHGIKVNAHNVWDTMLMFHLLYAELPKGLDTLCSIYTDLPYYKDDVKAHNWNVSDDALWDYNCRDTTGTWECKQRLLEEMKEFQTPKIYLQSLRKWNVLDLYTRTIQPLVADILKTEIRGVKIDTIKRAAAAVELGVKIVEAQARLDAVAGHALNVQSPKQLKEFFYKECGIEEQVNRKTGKVSTSEEILLKIQDKLTFEQRTREEAASTRKRQPSAAQLAKWDLEERVLQAIPAVLDIRGYKKIKKTYLEAQLDPDQRIRCSYNPAGTDFGRLASSKSPLGSGGNLQNIPPGITRDIFIADNCERAPGLHCYEDLPPVQKVDKKGETYEVSQWSIDPLHPPDICVFDTCTMWLAGDLSQAEARIVAYIAPETNMIAAFESGQDIHIYNASLLFDIPYESMHGESPERFIAKHLVHACNYKVGKGRFADTVNIKAKMHGVDVFFTPEKAGTVQQLYYTKFSGIPAFHKFVEDEIKRSHMLWNLMGRPHIFFDRADDNVFRTGYACIPQGTVADMVNIGYVRTAKWYPVVLQVHDSITTQIKPREVEQAMRVMEDSFRIPLNAHGKEFYIPMDFKIGPSWENAKKVKLPRAA